VCSPYAAHLRAPLEGRISEYDMAPAAIATADGTVPPGPLPGALPTDLARPLDPLDVDGINQRDAALKQAREDRLAAEGRGWDTVFGA